MSISIRQALLGLRPYVLVEVIDGEATLDLGGVQTLADGRQVLRAAKQGIRFAKRELRKRARQERNAQRLAKRIGEPEVITFDELMEEDTRG